ncbi:MAG: ribokinase [Bacillota bacterium]
MKKKVAVVGSYNTDLTIKTERIPRPGETIIGGKFSEGGGGKGANQAVAAARAGAEVSLIARVGNDVLGIGGIRRLSDEGINTDLILYDKDAPTGVAFIVVDNSGQNSIVVASGANAELNEDDIKLAEREILSAGILLVQLESPLDAIRSAVKKAHSGGLTVIMNPAPAQTMDEDLLSNIDIITPNEVEAEMITGIKVTDKESLREITRRFFDLGVKNVLITLGSKGVFAGLQNSMELIPALEVSCVDSTGAGDVFNGSLAAFLSEGMSIEKAAWMAGAAASVSVTRMGAQSSAPFRNEIEEFILPFKQYEVQG